MTAHSNIVIDGIWFGKRWSCMVYYRDLGRRHGPVGLGATKEQAIANLLQQAPPSNDEIVEAMHDQDKGS